MKVIVGTGWWSSDDDERKIKYGDDLIRSSAFSELWLKSLSEALSFEKIVVIDSCSPNKSSVLTDNGEFIEYISLLENGGHASNISGRHCGWSRGVVLSMLYAYFSGCDYYVYVEQDVLLKGSRIVEHITSKGNTGYYFGESKDFPQPLQQSFFAIRSDKIPEFVSKFLSIKFSDYEISCEVKFALCTSPIFNFLPKKLFVKSHGKGNLRKAMNKIKVKLASILSNFDYINIQGGRDRPIDFDSPLYYFQHGSEDEIKKYLK
ncbi:hypothetical protein NDJ14_09190 [Vibrio alginolyticus]|uniref:hypothetical protein n=1 Tax=Vibrio alginolyticus TaxID=663 RepID=UPI00215FC2C8|nr:hypothetical protein [Vibrio alginolyticus]MCS0130065.1 hypothetical protein [Vibrio alginolyticus]MCS0157119.1 hypothetical protein [Vibrio alginolyticus]HBN6276130.1 hypothetical protein [Vibrio parahaemolyticus]HBN6312891.1 hypothetical protein [Vibrio parahaemolyticus]